jgi:hypothetical protein
MSVRRACADTCFRRARPKHEPSTRLGVLLLVVHPGRRASLPADACFQGGEQQHSGLVAPLVLAGHGYLASKGEASSAKR